MATKQVSTVLLDEVIQLPDDKQLRLRFDLSETLQKIATYVDDLQMTRHIPFDLENMPPHNPILMYLTQHYAPRLKAKTMSENDIIHRTVQYYTRAKAEVQREATLIAIFAHPDNLDILSEAPEPYAPVATDNDPLVLQMPVIEKDISYPIERRLKRLTDVLLSTGAMFRIEGIIETLSVRMNMFAQELVEVDESGFQPSTIDGTLSPEVQPAGGEREVQKKSTPRRRVSGSDGDPE